MSLQDYHAAVRVLKENGIEILSSVHASADDMVAMELRLGVNFPPSYKAMLSEFGNMTFEGVEIYGWTRSGLNAKGVPDVVSTTEKDREKGLITGQMIQFMVAGYGPSFVLDCAEADSEGEAPAYEISAGGVARGRDKLADSFGSFLLKEAQRIVEEIA